MEGRRTPRTIVATVIVAALVGGAPALAIENESFGLAPFPETIGGSTRSTFEIPLEPGATYRDSIRVYNRTDQPLELVVYAADATYGPDGQASVGFRGSDPRGVGAWIDLERGNLSLPPRGEAVVPFEVAVQSTDPVPDAGAIVAENTGRGLRTDLDQRLHVVVRTSPPNSPTTSERVRPLLLRSPWIIVASLGLLLAIVLILIGARRARRRPEDVVTEPGELSKPPILEDDAPEASRPVLHHLGTTAGEEDEPEVSDDDLSEVIARYERTRQELSERHPRDEPEPESEDDNETWPLDEQPDTEVEPLKPARKSSRKLDYIPLDEL